MELRYPRSFLGLLLVGFAIVALPLIAGLTSNAFSIERLSEQSQKAIFNATVATQNARLLSSVVLASLSTARQKSRDGKRISDMSQIQLALELYFDATQAYPLTTGASFAADVVPNLLIANGFLPKSPIPPTGATYSYFATTAATGTVFTNCTATATGCLGYLLAIPLERTDPYVLSSDADSSIVGLFDGKTSTCASGAGSTEYCYDLKP